MNSEEQKRLFSWKSFKLVMPELYIFNLISSRDSIELSVKTKEKDGLVEVCYTWTYKKWDSFFKELEKFNQGVMRIKDFKNKVAVYNLGEKLTTNLFFTKEQWGRWFEFVSSAFKVFKDQKKVYAGF